jgi:hypothetical protein
LALKAKLKKNQYYLKLFGFNPSFIFHSSAKQLLRVVSDVSSLMSPKHDDFQSIRVAKNRMETMTLPSLDYFVFVFAVKLLLAYPVWQLISVSNQLFAICGREIQTRNLQLRWFVLALNDCIGAEDSSFTTLTAHTARESIGSIWLLTVVKATAPAVLGIFWCYKLTIFLTV